MDRFASAEMLLGAKTSKATELYETMPEPPPSWSECLGEISRRSKAGFGSVHSELLQRCGVPTAKTLSCINSPAKQQSRQTRMSKFFRQKAKSMDEKDSSRKSKDRKWSARQTFVSYVEEEDGDQDQDKDDVENVFVEALGEDSSVLNAASQLDGRDASAFEYRQKSDRSSETDSLNIKSSNQGIIEKPDDPDVKSPQSPYHLIVTETEEEPIYQVPRQSFTVTDQTHMHSDGYSPVSEDGAKINQPIYSNLDEVFESGHYDVPRSPSTLQEGELNKTELGKDKGDVIVTFNDETINDKMSLYENTQTTETSLLTTEADNDYIEMQGVSKSIFPRNKHQSCSVVEGKLGRTYENAMQAASEDLQIKTLSSAPSSPSIAKSRNSVIKGDVRIRVSDEMTTANDDTTDGYIQPDPAEPGAVKIPKSATVTPYIPEPVSPRSTLSIPTRPFLQYSVEEVVECFEVCALTQVAKVCKEENLDGEYFKDLTDTDLTEEPFCLNQFHISKIRKIIAGWRPKRLTN